MRAYCIYFVSYLALLCFVELCSRGFFGENCSFPCRCLDNSCQNTVNSPGCITGSCSPGYTDFPACQTRMLLIFLLLTSELYNVCHFLECEPGSFGLDCEHNCSCTPQNLCSHINGNCIPPNYCTPDRTGPACQTSKFSFPSFHFLVYSVRSKLTTAPSLEVICTSLTISWSEFNSSIDSGVSDVRKYR